MPCIVKDSGVCLSLSCIGTLVLNNTRIVECVIVIMGDTGSATNTVYLRPMSKWITPSSSVTSKILQDSIFSVIFRKVIFVTVSVLLG